MQRDLPSMTNRTLSGLIWMSLSSGANVGVLLLVLIVLARWLTPADFGLVAVALMVIGFSAIFSDFGIGPAIVQRPDLQPAHLRSGFALSLLLGVLLGAATWFAAPLAASFFQLDELIPILRTLAWIFPVQSLGVVAESLLQRELRFRCLAGLEIATAVFGYGGMGITLAVLGYGAWALVGAHMAQTLVKTLLLVLVRPHPARPVFDRRAYADLLYFGSGFTVGRFSNYAAGQGEHVVIGYCLGAVALGVYGRAYQLMAGPAIVFGNVLDRVLFPAMVHVQDQPQRLADAYRRGTALVALVILPLSVALVALAPEVVEVVLGPEWEAVVLPLQILGVGMLFRTGCKISDSLVRATGAVYRRGWRQTAYAILVIAAAWAGQWRGVEGVAVGILVTLAVNFFLMAHLSLRLLGMSWRAFAIAHLAGLALAIAVGAPVAATAVLLRAAGVPPIVVLAVSVTAIVPALILAGCVPDIFLGADGKWMARKLRAFIVPPSQPATVPVAPNTSDDHPLRLLTRNLASDHVRYCRWKGKLDLMRVLRGEGDLDLLVPPADLAAFLYAAKNAGFMQAIPCFESHDPGEVHVYAPDPVSGSLVHVHASSMLCSAGQGRARMLNDFILRHCAPETAHALLEGTPVVQAPAELIVTVLRAMDQAMRFSALLFGSAARQAVAAKLEALVNADGFDNFRELLVRWFPAVPLLLFMEFLEALRQPTSWLRLRRLARQLDSHWRRNCAMLDDRPMSFAAQAGAGLPARLWNLVCKVRWRALHGTGSPKQLIGEGAVIAIVGPDASGKSTMVAETARWLRGVFRVQTAHLGKPPSAWLTLVPNLLLRLLRIVTPQLRTSRQDAAAEANGRPVRRGLLYHVRAVMLAWDRRALARRLARKAARGWIVVCDRYPSAVVGTADGARLPAPVLDGERNRLRAYLARLENRLYSEVPAPTVVVQLTAPLAVAVHRNEERQKRGKESAEYVARRHKQFALPLFPQAQMRELDTSRPRDETVQSLRAMLWAALAMPLPADGGGLEARAEQPCSGPIEDETVALQES
jgi:PST family polysaccharide transporter